MTTHDTTLAIPSLASRRSRRRLLRDVAAGGAVAGASALGTGPWFLRGAAAQEKTKISLWFPFPLVPEEGEQVHTYAQLINDFNAQSPDVEAEVFVTNWTPERLVTAVAGGDPPDLFYMDRYLAAEWAARNLIEPLDERLAASEVVTAEDIWPKLIEDVTYQGQVFGVPHYTDVRAFYWNKAIFTEVGLDPETPPPTWTALKEYIPQIRLKNDRGQIDRLGYAPSIGNPPGFLMWYIHLWQLGGEFMNAEKTEVTFNNEAGVGSFQFMLDTFELQDGIGAVEEFASALVPGPGQDIFMLGRLGMEVHGDWMPPNFERYAPELQWGIGSLPIPDGGQPANYNGGHAWVMPRGAKNADAAWKLVEWMLMPENQLRSGLGENTIPARQGVAESTEYLEGEPADRADLRRLFVEEFKVSRWVPVIPGVGEIFASNARTYDEVMRKVITPEEGTQRMAEECQQILDTWQAQIQEQGGEVPDLAEPGTGNDAAATERGAGRSRLCSARLHGPRARRGRRGVGGGNDGGRSASANGWAHDLALALPARRLGVGAVPGLARGSLRAGGRRSAGPDAAEPGHHLLLRHRRRVLRARCAQAGSPAGGAARPRSRGTGSRRQRPGGQRPTQPGRRGNLPAQPPDRPGDLRGAAAADGPLPLPQR